MAEEARKGGKKNRKLGRNKRRPSQVRYVAENRAAKNKRLKMARHAKAMAKHAIKLAAWKRGIPSINVKQEKP